MKLTLKRLIDIFGAFTILLATSPFMVLAAIGILVTMGGPVLFRQERPGLGDEIFTLFKFRTMHDSCDPEGRLLPEEKRITPLGQLLRHLSVDELPQLLNVLRGEMSLVGPRPLWPRYLPYYTERERLRHSVKPGMTGWAQVNGRNNLFWNERLAFDVWYVEHQSLLLDLRILFLTFIRVLQGRDVDVDPRNNLVPLDEERKRSATPPV
jgi:lipopolysaccharide/colanic/teichoic acid biosynthesis glycosyltransferase